MIVGIDASNIRDGGGLTHLKELLGAAKPDNLGFEKVVVWGGTSTLDALPEARWLYKQHHAWLDRNLLYRVIWQRRELPRLATRFGCAVLFCPGGLVPKRFRPVVTMCRTLLPFEWREMRRYGLSRMFARLLMLRGAQADSFHRADGVIFLSQYAYERLNRVVKRIAGLTTVIPHGVSENFLCKPRACRSGTCANDRRPLRIVYVSIVDLYKHQWNVAHAVARLRRDRWAVELELIGPAYPPALRRLKATMQRLDPVGEFIRYRGSVPHGNLPAVYREADIGVFASSCENLPNILLEYMAAGLPIACSNRGPMPEVLGEAGVYFDPEDSEDIARALGKLLASQELRAEKAHMAFERAQQYSWRRCADETFAFLTSVANGARSRSATGAAVSERRIGS